MIPLLGTVVLQARQDSPIGFLIPMVIIFAIFYFLVMRPQQKQQRERDEMIKAIGTGDEVVTSGGIHGVVCGVTDDVLTVEIANLRGERVRIKVDRARIDRRLRTVEKPEKGKEAGA
jgi:preprotein translocase subunit YajC